MSFISTFEHLCDQIRCFYRRPMTALGVLLLLTWHQLLSASPADPDLFARLAVGRLVETLGFMPSTEPFAFSPTKSVWIDHEWLSGVVFWWILSHFGEWGLVAFKVLSASLTVILLFRASRILAPATPSPILFWALCLLQALFGWGSTIRCQTFTYLFISFLFFALLQLRERGVVRYVLLLPIISIAWVNLHGGYALGLLIIWVWTFASLLTGRNRILLTVVALASCAAPCFTPYGFKAYSAYLLAALGMSRPAISEWGPLWTQPAPFLGLLVTAIPIIWGMTRSWKSTRDLAALSLLALSTYLGVRHIRLEVLTMITFFVFGAPYIHLLSQHLRAQAPHFFERLARSVAAAGTALVIALTVRTVGFITTSSSLSLDLADYPVNATRWMRSHNLQGRLLVDFNNGSFALWRLYPRFQVSMDGRYEETYLPETDQLNAEAFTFGSPEGRRALEILQPTHILVRDTATDSSSRAEALGDPWRVLYSDTTFTVLGRSDISAAEERAAHETDDIWQPLF